MGYPHPTRLIGNLFFGNRLNPILLDWQLNLIVGLRRFVACKVLRLEQIEFKSAIADADRTDRLAKIDAFLLSQLNTLTPTENWQERDRISEEIKLKTLYERNCSQGGEIITQPSKTKEFKQELEYTQTTLEPLAQKLEEVKRQAKLAAAARIKQWQIQFPGFCTSPTERLAKIINREVQIQQSKSSTTIVSETVNEIDVQAGDRWFLEPHLIYCGDTSNYSFINSLPSNTALAIATPSPTWDRDYLLDSARVVAVLRSEGYIHELCRHHQMSFKFELLISDIYVGIFSRQSIPRPQRPIEIEGLEGIVSYLVNLYTNLGNSVILPFLGAGEVLIACERLGRICFGGDEDPQLVSRAIARWQNLTGKRAYKLFYRS
jgi:ParB family chromosome partitioning protein